MCFLGSEKYPEEGSYQNFIKTHGGTTNAFTGNENTNYHFSIANNQLEHALDMFAQFFIAPLFTESATQREVMAVDSEHKKNLNEDLWRQFQLLKSTSNPQHPFSKFGSGNARTLDELPRERNLNVRQALMDFHATYYSSNQMKLCVVGQHSLDQLEQWVRTSFASIKNRQAKTCSYYPTDIQPYEKEHLSKYYRVQSVSDLRDMGIMFPLRFKVSAVEGRNTYYKIKSERYVSHLLGHEGKGSLCSYLKMKGWINSITAGPFNRFSGISSEDTQFILFNVLMELTIEGEQHVMDIIEFVFEYINLMLKQGVQKWVYDEASLLAKLSFTNLEFPAPLQFASDMSQNLQKYLPEDVIAGAHLFFEYHEDEILKVIQQLNVDNFNIYFSKSSHEGDLQSEEPWYKTKYCVQDLDKQWIEKLRNIKHETEELFFPVRNPFIPTNLEIKGQISVLNKSVPEVIYDDKKLKIWFKQDDYFGTPRGNIFCSLIVPQTQSDPRNAVIVRIFTKLLADILNEDVYMAEVAGLTYDVSPTSNGLTILTLGYNDKILDLTIRIFTTLVKSCDEVMFTKERFELIRESLSRGYTNFNFSQPYEHGMIESLRYLNKTKFTPVEYAEVVDDITFEEFYNFIRVWIRTLRLEGLIHGNFTKEEALNISKEIEQLLYERPVKVKAPNSNQEYHENIAQLPLNTDIIIPVPNYNPTNANHSIEVIYQIGLRSVETDSVSFQIQNSNNLTAG